MLMRGELKKDRSVVGGDGFEVGDAGIGPEHPSHSATEESVQPLLDSRIYRIASRPIEVAADKGGVRKAADDVLQGWPKGAPALSGRAGINGEQVEASNAIQSFGMDKLVVVLDDLEAYLVTLPKEPNPAAMAVGFHNVRLVETKVFADVRGRRARGVGLKESDDTRLEFLMIEADGLATSRFFCSSTILKESIHG
ncbi:hypothetical protein V2J09_023433 [Rumex salicifolius]